MKTLENILVHMKRQPNLQEELASSVARLNEILQEITEIITSRPLSTPSRNADNVGQDLDQDLGGAVTQVVGLAQATERIGAIDLYDPISETAAQRKGLRTPAPKIPGKSEAYTC